MSADRLLVDAARAAQGARDRLVTAVADLFLPADARLTDLHRITMARMLEGIVVAVEDELRRLLIDALGSEGSPELLAALGTARVEIAGPIFERAQVLRDVDLVAILLRRVDEHRLVVALNRATQGDTSGASSVIDELIGHGDPGVAQAAMALLIAESRRFDRFGDPMVARTDLPAELQHRLIWWVAAALREYMVGQHDLDPIIADSRLVATATAMLAGYDEGETLEGCAFELALRLHRRSSIDDSLLERALEEGRLALFVAALALRAGIDGASVWDMVVDGEGSRLAVLLRSIDCGRAAAGGIMFRLASLDGRGEAELVERMDAFDALTKNQAAEAMQPWRLDEDYRRAIAGLAAHRGPAR